MDISEREQAEEVLRQYEFIVNSSQDMMTLIDSDYRYVAVNDSFCNNHNKSRDGILGRSVAEVWGENVFKKEVKKNLDKCLAGSHVDFSGWFEVPLRGRRHFEVMYAPFSSPTASANYAVVVSRDTTERKKAEKELSQLAMAVEQSAEAIAVTDTAGVILYVNPAHERIYGYSREELAGKRFDIFEHDDADRSFYDDINAAMVRGETWSGRLVQRRKDGTGVHVHATISLVLDSSGKVVNRVAVKREISDQIRIEEQLRQAQKMEAIGTLAGGIAHDFNNILSALIMNAELALMEDLPEDHPITYCIKQIQTASNRAKDLVDQILTFSRQREDELKVINLTPIIKEALKLLRASIPSTIDIRQTLSVKVDTVMAEPSRMHQILMNLCTNAAHAMRNDGGILEVALAETSLSETEAQSHEDLKPGKYLRLLIKDTGHGMSRSVMERVFEPYFTTKRVEEGTGLGLAVVHGIVKNLNGAITVESEEGKGCVFTVLLPLADANTVPVPDEAIEAPTGTEQIMYVDDETSITDIGERMLKRLGYTVHIENNSLHALETFRADPQRFDVVITDMTMPGITGDKLAAEMISIRPDIPIIICTGYSAKIDEHTAKNLGITELVMKPVVKSHLARSVRRAIDKSKQ